MFCAVCASITGWEPRSTERLWSQRHKREDVTRFQGEGQGKEGDHRHPWEGSAGCGRGSAALGGDEAEDRTDRTHRTSLEGASPSQAGDLGCSGRHIGPAEPNGGPGISTTSLGALRRHAEGVNTALMLTNRLLPLQLPAPSQTQQRESVGPAFPREIMASVTYWAPHRVSQAPATPLSLRHTLLPAAGTCPK